MRSKDMKSGTPAASKHKGGYWLFLPAIALGVFFLSGASADAKIEVKGDDDFKKAVADCIAAYEKMGGAVGTAIKRLKDSENEHVIEEEGSFKSSPTDAKKAGDGTGSGSRTRVSKKEWEDFKKKYDSLKSKDFCAVFLHELWHAVDADRGEFDRSKKKDGIPVDEFEAVLFQNIYHAAKGLALRETYGGKKVPAGVKLPEWVSPAAPAPEAEPAPAAPATTEEKKEPSVKIEEEPPPPPAPTATVSFAHVAPGEYSEVYVRVQTQANASVQATLSGPGVQGAATQTATANASGSVNFTWRIVLYGTYSVSGTAAGQSFSSSVSVQ